MSLVLIGLLVLAAAALAAMLLMRLPRQRAVAVLVLAVAGALALARQFVIAVPLALFALGLWQRSAVRAPTPGGQSSVESAWLRMQLDHASGVLDGEVIAGPLVGRLLSSLSPDELEQLIGDIEAAGDEDSLALILAWSERTGRTRPEPEAPPAAGGGPMSEAEAYRVLGLPYGASVEEVRAAYRRLIRRVHPDLGGSGGLAATLNAAKEVLDRG